MTALTVAVAVVIVGAAAIVQFRTAAVTTESAGGGGADRWAAQAPGLSIERGDGPAAGAPSSDGSATPFQIRPAAVLVVDTHQANPDASASAHTSGPDQPVAVSPTAGAATPPATTGSAEAPPATGDQLVRPAGSIEAPVQAQAPEPIDPAPVVVAETPPPPVPAPGPAPAPVPPPTAAPPPTPTADPAATPTRGKSAAHLPDNANGGVGNPDHPTPPANPGAGPPGAAMVTVGT